VANPNFTTDPYMPSHRIKGENMSEQLDNTKTSGATRRTVLKGAAWTAPVIAAAIAVPLASASTPPPATRYGASGSTQNGGEDGYFSAYGIVQGGAHAVIPSGTTITFTVDPTDAVGSVTVTNGSLSGPVDGVYTIVPTAGVTEVDVDAVFPSGTSATIRISGPAGNTTAAGSWQ
jgi:hypothetical protein